MRAALYARVSHLSQRERHTIESQLRVLPEYCRQMGWPVVGTYVDDGLTAKGGHLEDRKDFARLIAACAAGKVDVVVVVALDRLTRSEDLVERGAILGGFQRLGVKIAIVGAGVQDLNTFAGDAYVSLQGLFAAEWLRRHRQRIGDGKMTAILKGKKPAGPTPFGYRYDRWTGVWSVDAGEAETVRDIYRRVAAGESTQAIADDFTMRGVPRHQVVGRAPQWERARVYAIARSGTYRGVWLADKAKRLTIAVPPIVTDEQWHTAQASIAERNGSRLRGLSRARHTYLLQGLAVCELCGGAIHIAAAQPASWTSRNTKRPPTPARYVCVNHRRAPAGGERCPLPYLRMAEIDERLWGRLAAKLRPDQMLRAARTVTDAAEDVGTWEQDLVTAEAQLARLDRTQAALLERFRRELVTEAALDTQLEAMKRERVLLTNQVAGASRARKRAGGAQGRASSVRDLAAELGRRLATTDVKARRELLEVLLEPGGVILGPVRIQARGLISLGEPSSTSSTAGTKLRFRLVA